MKRVHHLHRKKPHLLPPLSTSHSSTLRAVAPWQPPDLVFTESRLGSPRPKPSDPVEFDYVCDESNKKPMIMINGICTKGSEKYNLMNFDLVSDSIFNKARDSMIETPKEKSFELPSLESGKGKTGKSSQSNSTEKKSGKTFADENRNMRQAALPLEGHESTKNDGLQFHQIRNRYALLKPIGEEY